MDSVLQVEFYQSRVERQNPLTRPADHTSFDVAQDMVDLLICEHTLLTHVQLFIHPAVYSLLHHTLLLAVEEQAPDSKPSS